MKFMFPEAAVKQLTVTIPYTELFMKYVSANKSTVITLQYSTRYKIFINSLTIEQVTNVNVFGHYERQIHEIDTEYAQQSLMCATQYMNS